MARASWLVDGTRIATKIKCASGSNEPGLVTWRSNPTKACPNCEHIIDNSDVSQAWPGLPRGVKFDPSDPEIIWHLITKSGAGNAQPHPFIDEFIPTVDEDDGICYTHPQNLPGVKQDGSVTHFFHRAIKAYNTGTRKRRKIHGDSLGDVRWHKTGRTKPVLLDGVQRGCKKIMVLYFSTVKGGKPEKTNWVMHQYHLGTEEDEKDGEYVISKVFYQQQQVKPSEKSEVELPDDSRASIVKLDPITPKSATPELAYMKRISNNFDEGLEPTAIFAQHHAADVNDEVEALKEQLGDEDYVTGEVMADGFAQNHDADVMDDEIETLKEQPGDEHHVTGEVMADAVGDETEKDGGDEAKWWENESPFLIDSQQLVEGLSLCDELLQSQSPSRDGPRSERENLKPRLSDYAMLGKEHLKKDLEACQDLVSDRDGDFRLSQLEFGSQDSYISWGAGKIGFDSEPGN